MTTEYDWIGQHAGVGAEEREHARRLIALREDLGQTESALASAVAAFDVEEAARLLPRRDVLRLVVAAAEERAGEYERGREHARQLADRRLSAARQEADRVRQSAVSEGRSLRRKLEEMSFEREAAQNRRGNGGAEWDAQHGGESARVESRLAELREKFSLTDWELSDASAPVAYR